MTKQSLKIGNRAPEFSLADATGAKIRLGDFKGRWVVLYFYPKDDTSGCTLEAREFSKAAKDFKAASAIVVGVSKDNVASHDRFKAKHRLALTLASDEDTETAKAYGVWVKKSMYGRQYMGMERATFLIDSRGLIRRIWRKVKVPGHVADVLNAVKAI